VTLLDSGVTANDDPEELAVQQISFQEVSSAMQGLTALQKQVLDLRFMRQLSTAETAARMDRSERAVKFLQHSAIKALRRRLGGRETD
jgi:RNA polymerase sigma-70 factor, ECF subfamily